MMRRELVWLVIVIVALLGLVYLVRSNGTASWVLWEKNMTTKDNVTTTTWEPLDGFDRLSGCHQSAREVIQSALDFMNSGGRKLTGARPDGRSAVYTADGAENTVDVRMLCFPGEFDPRPRP